MLGRIFPRQFDNTYSGHWLGIAIFILVIAVRALQGINSIVMTRAVMAGADGIPLNAFSPAASNIAVLMFALLGLGLLLIPAQGIVALIRYRAMIPFLYLSMILMQIANRAIHFLYPDERTGGVGGHPIGFYVNMAILAVTIAGFVLSISGRASAPSQPLARGEPSR